MSGSPDPTDPTEHLAGHRFDYETAGLDVADVDADPMVQWRRWFDEAVEAGCTEPNAFVLSTDERGFTCFTNYESAKSRELATTGRASMLFTWLQLHRQVRVTVAADRVPEVESDEYFASRPRMSQVGAWASPQSQPIPDRAWLEDRVQQMTVTFGDGAVLRPAFWGGWLLRPMAFEFWQGRPSRLHDRLRYTPLDDGWQINRLSP
jgi:pyridoxamine 5'-phosphate oxidase